VAVNASCARLRQVRGAICLIVTPLWEGQQKGWLTGDGRK
jgi:hypothetical protein